MAKKKSAATDTSTSPAAPVARKRTSGAGPRTTAGNGEVRHPTHDEIAEAAYHRYLSRQGGGGSDFDDWLQAERELRSRSASKTQ